MKPIEVPADLRRLARKQDGMLTWSQVRAAGIRRWQFERCIRDDGWVVPCRGTVLLPDAHPVRGPARAALVGRPSAVICNVTAAALLGLPGLPDLRLPPRTPSSDVSDRRGPASAGNREGPGTMVGAGRPGRAAYIHPVHVLLPRSAHGADVRGLVRHLGAYRAQEVVKVRGIPVTEVTRTLVDLLVSCDRETAVGLLDAALHQGRITDIGEIRDAAAGRRGVAERYGWLGLVDGRAESPLETRMRLVLMDAGLTPEQLQWSIWGDGREPGWLPEGSEAEEPYERSRASTALAKEAWSARPRLLARVDLAWPSRLVAVEVDGTAVHEHPRALFRDRARQNDLLSLGWIVLRFTWTDLLLRAHAVIEQIRWSLQVTRPATTL
ncbi:endonuclease domain-containing protein [Frankia sp. AgPm24]|nr:endonuclease domain-containing protein [Frankia sp. AgPm24]